MRSLTFWLCLFVPAVSAAQPSIWTIDPGHSAAQFSVRHMTVSHVKGEFDGPTGTMTFNIDLELTKAGFTKTVPSLRVVHGVAGPPHME